MNVKGLKNILREVDKRLNIKLCCYKEDGRCDFVFDSNIEELMKYSKYDKNVVESFECHLMSIMLGEVIEYTCIDDVEKDFYISVAIRTQTEPDEAVTMSEFREICFNEDMAVTNNLLHKSFVADMDNFENLDAEDQEIIIRAKEEYFSLPVDYITLNFDKKSLFELFTEDPDIFWVSEEVMDIEVINLFPALPDGMWLFG